MPSYRSLKAYLGPSVTDSTSTYGSARRTTTCASLNIWVLALRRICLRRICLRRQLAFRIRKPVLNASSRSAGTPHDRTAITRRRSITGAVDDINFIFALVSIARATIWWLRRPPAFFWRLLWSERSYTLIPVDVAIAFAPSTSEADAWGMGRSTGYLRGYDDHIEEARTLCEDMRRQSGVDDRREHWGTKGGG